MLHNRSLGALSARSQWRFWLSGTRGPLDYWALLDSVHRVVWKIVRPDAVTLAMNGYRESHARSRAREDIDLRLLGKPLGSEALRRDRAGHGDSR